MVSIQMRMFCAFDGNLSHLRSIIAKYTHKHYVYTVCMDIDSIEPFECSSLSILTYELINISTNPTSAREMNRCQIYV